MSVLLQFSGVAGVYGPKKKAKPPIPLHHISYPYLLFLPSSLFAFHDSPNFFSFAFRLCLHRTSRSQERTLLHACTFDSRVVSELIHSRPTQRPAIYVWGFGRPCSFAGVDILTFDARGPTSSCVFLFYALHFFILHLFGAKSF